MGEIDPWKTRSDEEEADDLFLEEEGDEEMKQKKKKVLDELKNAGMLPVSGSDWKKKLKDTLIEACKDEGTRATLKSNDTFFANISEKVEEASKATCLVIRRVNSKSRLKFFEERGDKERLEKANSGKGACGTGFLLFPRSTSGWFVITNNHVIMDEEEAKSAEVIFDRFTDESLNDDLAHGAKRFKVKQLVSKDIRTENAKDFKSLDFSVLVLESEGDFLEEYAKVHFDERDTNEICRNKTTLSLSGVNFVPIIAFSHPHGAGKRFSIGKYPDKCDELSKSHIAHDLPTERGSSGANLIYSPPPYNGGIFVFWNSAFLHYRHGKAVSWQAIGPTIRKHLSNTITKQT